ncbi:sugar phosphate isomerase/epimerase family protein [Shouchella shacheensis]|uniref:sugar phosphate isomerase/epimerase family protein n=1 Tax=Shouchella shacheensis TaxID=1649580 RepID=UPI00073FDE49|nr:sugar phosphate isomerase/epimerase [Shouchella shacheensis]
MQKKFAATLYTLRNELKEQGIPSVFKELAQMGWAGVQISSLPPGYDPEEVAASIKENGFKAAGMHVSLDRLRTDLGGVLEEARLYNTVDIICPFLPKEYQNAEGYQQVKFELNEIAKESPDFRISYHNHAFEFDTTIEGTSALEYLLEPTSDNQILAEIDVYWVKKGGQDPLAFIQSYKNRMPVLHLKDMTVDTEETFAEVGTGSIDFPPILQWGEENGVEWYVVEQDICKGKPMDSLRISLTNLQEMAKRRQVSG